MQILDFLKLMVEHQASDLFLRTGGTPRIRVNGLIATASEHILSEEDMHKIVDELLSNNEDRRKKFQDELDIDFSLSFKGLGRFRINIFIQRGTPSIVIRYVKDAVATMEELNLPADILKKFAMENRGLVLVTGPAGSGKSTTIASMIEYINENSEKHIISLEDPIEYIFRDKHSIINQRELSLDFQSYASALKHLTQQSPDVIYIGVIRDAETMHAALSAAEMGVLLFSTFHTINTMQTIERIMNFFPPYVHDELRMQLSLLLKGIISLRLIPCSQALGRIPIHETMVLTPTIARLIREGKLNEMQHFIEEGSMFGMQSFRQTLVKLVKEGKISEDIARNYSDNKDEFELALKGIKRIA